MLVKYGGAEIEVPTGLIHLSAAEHTANLSEYLPRIEAQVLVVMDELESEFAKHELSGSSSGSDLLVKMGVRFTKDGQLDVKN